MATAKQVSDSIDTNRNCTIQIDNMSKKYSLINPRVYMYHGFNRIAFQPTIRPESTSICAFTKTPDTACGAIGVLTYDLCMGNQSSTDRIALLFSVPYNYNFYENIFAIGVISTGRECDDTLYNEMYYKKGSFKRDKAKNGAIDYSTSSVTLRATMSNMAKAIITLEIYEK